jgi:multidrug resistance efflux pump
MERAMTDNVDDLIAKNEAHNAILRAEYVERLIARLDAHAVQFNIVWLLEPVAAALRQQREEIAHLLDECGKAERLWKQESIRAERAENTCVGLTRAEIEMSKAQRAESELAKLYRGIIDPLQDRVTKAEAELAAERKDGVTVRRGRDGTWIELTTKSGKHFVFQPIQQFPLTDGDVFAKIAHEWASDQQAIFDAARERT